MRTVSFKLSAAELKRISAKNRSEFLRAAVHEKLERRQGISRRKPRPVSGKSLLWLGERQATSGARLLLLEDIREEIRERHGGLAGRQQIPG